MTTTDLEKLKAKLPLSKSTLAKNLPPPVTADASAELGPATVNADQPGREVGSHSKERAAAAPKRIRQSSKSLLNALEAEWFERIRYTYPNYPPVRPQAKRYKIARSAWYKPDFSASIWPNLDSDGETIGQARETCWEVKGNKGKNIDRGKLALKVAASCFPEVRWILVWKVDGVWKTQEVLP